MSLLPPREKTFSSKRIKAKTPYEAWFIKLGGYRSNNKMPRGKKFRAAVKHLNNKNFMVVNVESANRFISGNSTQKFTWARSGRVEIFSDEIIEHLNHATHE